jgi:hypothetical protein
MDLKVLKAVIKLELIVIFLTIIEIPKLYKRLKIGIYTEGIKSVFPNWKPPGP